MRLALIILPLVVLASACSKGDDAPAAPAAEMAAPAVLGGVDLNQPLRAIGTEPFWGVEITPQSLVYSGVDRAEQRATNAGPVIQGTTAVYTAATGSGAALVVTLIATECSDGMSDRIYPLTARVELSGETLNGCAASQASLDAQPAP